MTVYIFCTENLSLRWGKLAMVTYCLKAVFKAKRGDAILVFLDLDSICKVWLLHSLAMLNNVKIFHMYL